MIEQAQQYILDNVDDAALEYPNLPIELRTNVLGSKQFVLRFKKVGDLYRYLKRFKDTPEPGTKPVYDGLKKLGLKTYEDIFPEFQEKFKSHLDEITTLDDFVIGETYSSWDIAIFSKTYSNQQGIYLIGEAPNYKAIFVKATLAGGKYPNEWIVPDEEFKYYMFSLKQKFDPNYKVNKAIIESSNTPIYVFIKEDTRCTLTGIFSYQGYVEEDDGSKWFSLRKNDSITTHAPLSKDEYDKELKRQINKSSRDPEEERNRRLDISPKKPDKVQAVVTTYKRNADVIVSVLRRAAGVCEGCGNDAPFIRASDGSPYLEVHHIIPLSKEGEDTVENAIGLCPNCHCKAHYG